jgi:iron donor protein CyaY
MLCIAALASPVQHAMHKRMDDTTYHATADATLAHLSEALEAAYDTGSIEELELQGGILTIRLPGGRVYLVSKHAPTQQLWLASPVSGGLHFRYEATTDAWILAGGQSLPILLTSELANEGIKVTL